MTDYVEYDTVKLKLRLPDDSLFDEIHMYMQEVTDLINQRLRARLGYVADDGSDIDLPLTTSTVPAIDNELKSIAADLVEGKFVLKTAEKPLKWDTAVKNLDDYLQKRFGWVRDVPFIKNPNFTISPSTLSSASGGTLTIGGTEWRPNSQIKIYIDGTQKDTTPTTVTTGSTGSFSSTTVTIAANTLLEGSHKIKVLDGHSGKERFYLVTP